MSIKLPPGPSRSPVAQLLQFTYRPLELLSRCLERYGDPFTLRVAGLGEFVALTAPELIKQVFTADPAVMHAGEANVILEPILGKSSLLLLDGKPHAEQRRLLMPPLHGERMQSYARLMAEIARTAVEAMPKGRPFSLHGVMQSITLKVILRAVFGLEVGAQMDGLERRLLELLHPPPALATFIPVKYLDFPLSPYRTFIKRKAAVDEELRAIIRTRRDGPAGDDILSLLLSARHEDGEPMSDGELRDELMTLLLAGHETTATALSWAFGCLLENSEAAERLQAELETARDPSGGLETSALPRLEYLDAVVKETLRLRPILPDVVRRLQAPVMVAGYEIPPKVNLMPCIYLAHRRPETYPEPDRFHPERFLGVKPDPNAWLPFGGGVRRCIGMAFALYEMKIVLGETLLRARLRLASKRPLHVVRRTVTLAPSGGTRVVRS